MKKNQALFHGIQKGSSLVLLSRKYPSKKVKSIQEYTEITSFTKHNKANIASPKIDHIKKEKELLYKPNSMTKNTNKMNDKIILKNIQIKIITKVMIK